MDLYIAVGQVAKESADVIILDDRFQTIVTQAKWGRAVYTNIQKFVQFQLTVNLVALVINFTSACITGKKRTSRHIKVLLRSLMWRHSASYHDYPQYR